MVIMGCGRVGAKLAADLDEAGHSIAVIDQSASSFARLPAAFAGITVTGVGFDRDTLLRSGIERASAFAAVSSGDNSNIIAARVVREGFGVENVVARIYDLRRAEVYQRLGIPTVATVGWTAEQVMREMLPTRSREEWMDPSGQVTLGVLEFHPDWVGTRYSDLAARLGITVATVDRYGRALLPEPNLVVQEDDRLRAVYRSAQTDEILAVLSAPPQEEQ